MANKNKQELGNGFMIYLEGAAMLDVLSLEDKGLIVGAVIGYYLRGEPIHVPEKLSIIADIIRTGVDRSLESWQRLSERGKKGADARWNKDECISNAQAMHKECNQSQSQNHNHNHIHRETRPAHTPAREEVDAYCEEAGLAIDPGKFFDYYAAMDWKSKGEPITDWKALARYWNRTETKTGKQPEQEDRYAKYDDSPFAGWDEIYGHGDNS